MKIIRPALIPLCLSALLLSGCELFEDEPDTSHKPEDTMTGGTGGPRADYIDSDTITPTPLGGPLVERDPAFNQGLNNLEGVGGSGSKILATIQFGFDEFTVPAGQRAELDGVAQTMSQDASLKVIAEGHTDWYGTTEYNLGLGDRRANAVREYLIRQGVSPNRVEVLSLGELEADPELPKTHPSVIDDRRVDVIQVN
ncbi:MAG: OmpA family protein [Verrucomicrobiota bacterium]